MDFNHIRTRFKGTQYTEGFQNNMENSGYNAIAFGIGWGQLHLYMILIKDSEIRYNKSAADFGRIHGYDVNKIMPYTDDFYIPEDVAKFEAFLKEK